MAYIGKQPLVGNYTVLDALTATTTDTYALTKNSVAVFPQTPANCIVSLNGVIQAPFSSYNISGSNIVFDSALTGSDSIDFITVLGDVLNVGTVSDGTISTAKLANGAVTSDKLASGVGGKVLQVVSATTTTTTSTSSTSFVATSLSASITPSSTANKILVFSTSGTFYNQVAGYGCIATIYRDATELSGVTYGFGNTWSATARIQVPAVIGTLDSPSSISSLSYSLRIKSENASGTAVHLPNNDLARIILMEIKG